MGGIQIDPKLAEALEGKSPEELQAMSDAVLKARMSGRGAVASGTHKWVNGRLVATSDKFSDIIFDETGTYQSGGGLIERKNGEEEEEEEEETETEEEETEDDSEFALTSLKSAFMSALLETGLDTETITKLWEWAEGRFTSDSSFTAAQALVEMYDQDAFKKRFPGIAHMRDMAEVRRDIPSPREYLEREGKMKQWFNQYGLDAFAVNLDNVVAESFISSVGDAELLERMQTASRLIYEAPQEVKQTFEDWYGPASDAALMAAFLDPDDQVFGNDWKSLTTLKNQAETAEIGGWSRMYMDLDSPIDKAQAEAIGKLGLQQSQIWSKFGSIKEQENLFLEKQGEMDLTMEGAGVAAEFGIDYDTMSGQDLANMLDRRLQRRTGQFRGGGGAIVSGTRTGLGSANA
tara:strand:- start:21 stop:1235 length:1215 start_codon:yes stop_codon:yes gene_type:complete